MPDRNVGPRQGSTGTRCEGASVLPKPPRLLGNIDVNRCAKKDGCGHQRQQANHVLSPPLPFSAPSWHYADTYGTTPRCATPVRESSVDNRKQDQKRLLPKPGISVVGERGTAQWRS